MQQAQGQIELEIEGDIRCRINQQASVIVGIMNGERTLGDIILELRSAFVDDNRGDI